MGKTKEICLSSVGAEILEYDLLVRLKSRQITTCELHGSLLDVEN